MKIKLFKIFAFFTLGNSVLEFPWMSGGGKFYRFVIFTRVEKRTRIVELRLEALEPSRGQRSRLKKNRRDSDSASVETELTWHTVQANGKKL